MSHYDCKYCGEYLCMGECRDPENVKERIERERASRIRRATAILQDEVDRRNALEDARRTLRQEGKWDENRYGRLFD